ncbi:hypothetical protein HDF14_002380, partial [Edaphobacter lichenicola]|nr:hypothetical protein [Edaphobacter lichenicola]
MHSSTREWRRILIHSDDIAAVSAEALLSEEYAEALLSEEYIGRSMPITGPKALSFGKATATIESAVGKVLRCRPFSDEEAGERYARVSGPLEETQAHRLIRFCYWTFLSALPRAFVRTNLRFTKSSMSALAFHEKAGPCQGHVVGQVILFSPFANLVLSGG